MVVGVIWTAQARTVAPDDPNLRAMALNDPKIFGAVSKAQNDATAMHLVVRRVLKELGGERAAAVPVLYGGSVTLWVQGDDDSIAEIGPRVPSSASAGLVAPITSRLRATAFSPSSTCTTTGPEVMNVHRSL